MKTTGICPKCQSAAAARVKAFKGTSTSNVIQLSKWGTRMAFFDRYICTNCGFIEEYARLEDKAWQKWIEEESANNTLDSDFV